MRVNECPECGGLGVIPNSAADTVESEPHAQACTGIWHQAADALYTAHVATGTEDDAVRIVSRFYVDRITELQAALRSIESDLGFAHTYGVAGSSYPDAVRRAWDTAHNVVTALEGSA